MNPRTFKATKQLSFLVLSLWMVSLAAIATSSDDAQLPAPNVELQPGETQMVSFEISEEALAYYDDGMEQWIAEPGTFELFIGGSSHDLQVAAKFELVGGLESIFDKSARLNIGLPIAELLADDAAKAVLEKYLGVLLEAPQVQRYRQLSLERIAPHSQGFLTQELLQKLNLK